MKTDHFKGMNDVTEKTRSMDEPDVILNAHVTADGALEKRDGCEKITDLPGAHSLWTNRDGTVLCMAEGCLYVIKDNVATLLVDTGEPDAPTSYLYLSGRVYFANAYYTGMYDPATGTVGHWGTSLPAAPVLIPVNGGLPAGTYQVCFTVPGVDGRPSGNGALSQISLNENEGLSISNLPAGASVWMTDPNGSQLYFAGAGSIITELPSPEPIPTMWGSPPLPMSNLCYAHGLVFGSRGSRIYYSEPYQPELFRLADSFFDVGDLIGMIAKTSNGLYVGCRHKTYFFSGRSPIEMIQRTAGNEGVVPGSLCYASSLAKIGKNVPVWLGPGGVFAGTVDGQVVNLVTERVKVDPEQDRGASIYRVKDGQTRMLFSYKQKGQQIGMGDSATCEVIRNGSVIQNP